MVEMDGIYIKKRKTFMRRTFESQSHEGLAD